MLLITSPLGFLWWTVILITSIDLAILALHYYIVLTDRS